MANLAVTTSPGSSGASPSASGTAPSSNTAAAPSNATGAPGSSAAGPAFQAVLDQQTQGGAPSQEIAAGRELAKKSGPTGTSPDSGGPNATATKAKDAKAADAIGAAQVLPNHALATANPPVAIAAAVAAAAAQPATPADPSGKTAVDVSSSSSSVGRATQVANNDSNSLAPAGGVLGPAASGSAGIANQDGTEMFGAQANRGAPLATQNAPSAKGSPSGATARLADATSVVPSSVLSHTAAPLDPASLTGATAMAAPVLPSSTVATTPSSSISAPIGSEGFSGEAAQKILYFVQSGVQSAQLHLNPAHLGPLDVQIRLDGNQVSVALASGHMETRHALEASVPQLRQMFGEQGIALGNVSVGAHTFSSGSGAQQQSFSGSPGSHAQNALPPAAAREPALPVHAVQRAIQMVDTFA